MSLLEALLTDQQTLTAVERFSRLHDAEALPSQARYYSALLPARPPGEGEQYAFEVDLDACSGCKACVTACHSLNGLDPDETWRDVGLLHGGSDALPVLQHVTSACHHCLEPACMDVCPVGAYEKDPRTGIVRHLDDQCFGCQYCILACPYDVPKYNKAKGIVRKCDLCSDRLAAGEAPACVQACPHEAIRVTVVNRQDVVANSETNLFLPGAPEPQHTLPTTNYKTRRPLPRNLLPADYYSVRPEHAHWPLVLMLVLTQLSVGAFLVELLLNALPGRELPAGVRLVHSAGALLFGLLALGASTCHLGRPRYAFRAVIGLRTSWLSREIVAFGLFAALSTAYAVVMGLSLGGGPSQATDLERMLGIAVVTTGLCGVGCSIMIYVVTRRPFWSGTATTARFLLTTLLLGLATALLTSRAASLLNGSPHTAEIAAAGGSVLCKGLIAVAAAKLLFEAGLFRHLGAKRNTPLKRSARLMTGELARATQGRFVCGLLAGIALPALLLGAGAFSPEGELGDVFVAAAVLLIFVGCLTGELLERYLFFTAVVAPKMPGGLTT